MTKKGFLTGALGFTPPKGRKVQQPIPQNMVTVYCAECHWSWQQSAGPQKPCLKCAISKGVA